MKEDKEDRILRELFRQKLGNAEVNPSPSAGRILMRKLWRRESLRFNPGRFNIWYAGGIIAAGAALAIILSSGNDNNTSSVPDITESDKVTVIDVTSNQKTSSDNQKPVVSIRKTVKQKSKNSNISSETTDKDESDKSYRDQRYNIPSRTDFSSTLSENRFFGETSADINRLRGVKQASDLIEASVTEGCCPLKVLFTSSSQEYDSCKWTFGDGGYSFKKNPEWIFDVEGEYEVSLQIFDSEGLYSTSSSIIVVYPKPEARFEIVTGNKINTEGEISFLNYSADAVKFRWDFGDGNTSDLYQPKYTYRRSGNYNISLVATSENGCSDTLIISNAYTGSGYFINFPNAFIPNPGGPSSGYYSATSDEAAHIFHPVFSGVSDYQLRIFSKHGVLIFESNDINVGWDGYYKGQLSGQGVYIWKVRGSFINGEQFTKMGDLTLLRN